MQFLIAVRMVPFLSIGLSSNFRAFDVNVAPCITTAARRGAQGWWGRVTSDGTEFDWGRISKIRARQSVRNKQGYNSISGLYRLGPTVRPASVPPKRGSHQPVVPRKGSGGNFFVASRCPKGALDACTSCGRLRRRLLMRIGRVDSHASSLSM